MSLVWVWGSPVKSSLPVNSGQIVNTKRESVIDRQHWSKTNKPRKKQWAELQAMNTLP
jgi:hypothetical protein